MSVVFQLAQYFQDALSMQDMDTLDEQILHDLATAIVDWTQTANDWDLKRQMQAHISLLRKLCNHRFELGSCTCEITLNLEHHHVCITWQTAASAACVVKLAIPADTAPSAGFTAYNPEKSAIGPNARAISAHSATESGNIIHNYGADGILTKHELQTLLMILKLYPWTENLLRPLYQHEMWFYTNKISPRSSDPFDFLVAMLESLNQASTWDSTGSCPLLRLLLALRGIADANLEGQLAAWIDSFAHLNALPLIPLPALPLVAKILHILIIVQYAAEGQRRDRFLIHAWKAYGGDDYSPVDIDVPSRSGDGEYGLKDLPLILTALLNHELKDDLDLSGDNTIIEWAVPRELIDTELDHYESDVEDGDWPVGRRYAVVVRPLERHILRKWGPVWHKHAAQFAAIETLAKGTHWLASANQCVHKALFGQLITKYGLALAFPRTSLSAVQYEELWKALLQTGVPLAIWTRSFAGDTTLISTTLLPLLQHGLDLPHQIYTQRTQIDDDHPLYRLTLLWDDPRRKLPI